MHGILASNELIKTFIFYFLDKVIRLWNWNGPIQGFVRLEHLTETNYPPFLLPIIDNFLTLVTGHISSDKEIARKMPFIGCQIFCQIFRPEKKRSFLAFICRQCSNCSSVWFKVSRERILTRRNNVTTQKFVIDHEEKWRLTW